MTDLTDEKWQRLRVHFGDLAYEHPEMHSMMLDLLDANDLDAALEKQQMRCASASPRVWPSASRHLAWLATAACLSRPLSQRPGRSSTDTPPDTGDELN